jgi:hypothetical protein
MKARVKLRFYWLASLEMLFDNYWYITWFD